MKYAAIILFLTGCSSRPGKSFEQANRESKTCDTETSWVEQTEPGNWVAMCGDENGNPLKRAIR